MDGIENTVPEIVELAAGLMIVEFDVEPEAVEFFEFNEESEIDDNDELPRDTLENDEVNRDRVDEDELLGAPPVDDLELFVKTIGDEGELFVVTICDEVELFNETLGDDLEVIAVKL